MKIPVYIPSALSNTELLCLVSAASVLRKKEHLKSFIKYAVSAGISRRKLYESLLQTYLFSGFPSALISLKILSDILSEQVKPFRKNDNRNFYVIGERTCKKIYGAKFSKLISNIQAYSPELSEWLVTEGYGKVLSRPGLSLVERELEIISVLSALKFEDQLYSHINGAVRLKTSPGKISRVISNLELIKPGLSSFGNKVFRKYLNKKGIEMDSHP